jgi:hypothetical protein
MYILLVLRKCSAFDALSYLYSYKRITPNPPPPYAPLFRRGLLRYPIPHRIPKWITPKDIKVMKKLYAQATRKTLATGVKYHVDHIIPLRGKLVSGLHVPSNLQVISAKENLVKNNTYICE